jgi:hypothetical protein
MFLKISKKQYGLIPSNRLQSEFSETFGELKLSCQREN